MKAFLERESKWQVDEAFSMPPLDDLISDTDVGRRTLELTSEYFDTPDRDLQTHGVTLRRRLGEDDTGWQLKVPAEGGRVEIHVGGSDPGATDPVPDELTRLLTGLRIGKDLVPVARIHTIRDRYRIVGTRDLKLCAEVDDDLVEATADGEPVSWREIEVELGPAAKSMPRRLVNRLTSAGAEPAQYPSKLSRVVPRLPSQTWGGPAGNRALAEYLHAQIDAVFTGDLALRRGHDPIHDTRVAIRRLRSTLRVFANVLNVDAVSDTQTELQWFAGLLGEVRDCEVQRRRFHDALTNLPTELVLGPVATRIDTDLHATQLQARSSVAEAMDSQRYLDLLALLQRWRTDLPVDGTVTVRALRKHTSRAAAKADRRLEQALAAQDDALLHRARKAAKRARYAAELVSTTSGGSKSRRNIKRYKKIQSVLGDHQDSMVAADIVKRLAVVAGTTPGENGFTFGLLYAAERDAARTARQQADHLR
jgi:CHAD domain-containing protein